MKKSASYAELQKQIESLQAQAEKQRRAEVGEVVSQIKAAIAAYGITSADLGFGGGGSRRPRGGGKSGGVKYRNDAGQTWGGRGPRPRWLRDAVAAGKPLSDFAV